MRPNACLISIAGFILIGLSSYVHPASPSHCMAVSTERRISLLELYTSEGCDSCPPTDKWLSGLPARGFGSDRIVALAYHVDYWDYIGWRDPYAQARFSERQRFANGRNGARQIYTPQLMLNGRDYRRSNDDASHFADLGKSPARASIQLDLRETPSQLTVAGGWKPHDAAAARQAQGWIALYENRLSTDVRAGENRGRRLQHEFVVRDLIGPLPSGLIAQSFALDDRWKRADLGIAAFVIDGRTGDTLQALSLPNCRAPA